MDKVIAVVVTHNRQQLLSECIDALRNQTRKPNKILVINNFSTDNTKTWLQQQPDIESITQINVGSAGGFYTGIQTAYKQGYNWIWLMDDDGYVAPDALEKLLEDDEEDLCVRNCAVLNKDDKKSFVWKTKNYKSIEEVGEDKIQNISHLFNGTLLHRKIIERVGLPKLALFLWGDETEYFYRIIKKHSIPFYTKTNSILYHPKTSFTYKQDWKYTSDWKMYYYVRNRFHVHKSKFCKSLPFAALLYTGFLFAFAASILVHQKTDKLKKLAFIFWPAFDAFTNNFNATPESILERLNGNRHVSINFANTNMRTVRSLLALSQPAHTAIHE